MSWPRPPTCWRRCGRTSCCRPPTRSRSASNSGRCPTNSSCGTRAAVDLLAGLGTGPAQGRRARLGSALRSIERHERELRDRTESGLAALDGVTVHSRAAERTPTLLLTFDDRDAVDAYHFLAERGVHAPAGSFYALEASRHLGLGDTGGLRVGFAPYNDEDDVERLLEGLAAFLKS